MHIFSRTVGLQLNFDELERNSRHSAHRAGHHACNEHLFQCELLGSVVAVIVTVSLSIQQLERVAVDAEQERVERSVADEGKSESTKEAFELHINTNNITEITLCVVLVVAISNVCK